MRVPKTKNSRSKYILLESLITSVVATLVFGWRFFTILHNFSSFQEKGAGLWVLLVAAGGAGLALLSSILVSWLGRRITAVFIAFGGLVCGSFLLAYGDIFGAAIIVILYSCSAASCIIKTDADINRIRRPYLKIFNPSDSLNIKEQLGMEKKEKK